MRRNGAEYRGTGRRFFRGHGRRSGRRGYRCCVQRRRRAQAARCRTTVHAGLGLRDPDCAELLRCGRRTRNSEAAGGSLLRMLRAAPRSVQRAWVRQVPRLHDGHGPDDPVGGNGCAADRLGVRVVRWSPVHYGCGAGGSWTGRLLRRCGTGRWWPSLRQHDVPLGPSVCARHRGPCSAVPSRRGRGLSRRAGANDLLSRSIFGSPVEPGLHRSSAHPRLRGPPRRVQRSMLLRLRQWRRRRLHGDLRVRHVRTSVALP